MKIKNFIIHSKKIFGSKTGMSLVESVIVVSILSLAGLGTTTLMTTTARMQQRSNTRSSFNQLKNNLKNIINNDTAWARMIALSANQDATGANLSCLRDNLPQAQWCTHGYTGTDFDVVYEDGTSFYTANTATSGFTNTGATCSTYSSSGNDDCPFRYTLKVTYKCPGTSPPTTCKKPSVKIDATLVHSPATSGSANRVNLDDYAFTINRGERIRYNPFEIRYVTSTRPDATKDGSAGNRDPGAGGLCQSGTTTKRKLNQIRDAGDSATLDSTNDQFTLQPGSYECQISTQAFAASAGFAIILKDTTNSNTYSIGSGFGIRDLDSNGVCRNCSSTTITGQAQFSITAQATFELLHYCGAGGSWSKFDMGFPRPDYTDSVYTTISCVRSS